MDQDAYEFQTDRDQQDALEENLREKERKEERADIRRGLLAWRDSAEAYLDRRLGRDSAIAISSVLELLANFTQILDEVCSGETT